MNDTFLMLCYVAADFLSSKGDRFRIEAKDIGNFVMAPAWIKDTLMYKWLLADGSIVTGQTGKEQKRLENDPMEGVTAEGKAEEATEEKPKATRRKKGEAK